MRGTAIIAALCFIAASILYLSNHSGELILPTVDSGSIQEAVPSRGFFPLVHFTFNWYLTWRFDPVIESLSPFLSGTRHSAHFILVVIFLLGTTLAGLMMRGVIAAQPLALSSLVVLILFSYFGADTVLWGTIAWTPLLAVAMYLLRDRPTIPVFLFFVLTGIVTVCAANTAAFISVVFSYLLMRAINLRATPEEPDSSIQTSCISVLLVVALCSGALVPAPDYPHYPPYARVVDDDGIPGHPLPLVGQAPPLPVIDREALRPVSTTLGLLLLLWGIASLPRPIHRLREDPLLLIGLFCGASLFLDGHLLSESANLLFPLSTLSRILPGLFVTPLHFVAFGLGATCLALRLTSRFATATDLIAIAFVGLYPVIFSSVGVAPLARFSQPQAGALFLDHRHEGTVTQRLLSPSYRIFRDFGSLAFSNSERDLRSAPKLLASAVISASSGSALTEALRDGDLSTRWSSGSGNQNGTEWLTIGFESPREIGGLELHLGPYIADFPRGVSVSLATGCGTSSPQPIREIVSVPRWLGPLAFTKEGHPFFEGQSTVRIVFPEEIAASCLLVRQTGTTAYQDWSVTELSILRERKRGDE